MLLSGLSRAGVTTHYDAREMRDEIPGQPDCRTPVPVPHAVRNCEPKCRAQTVKYPRDLRRPPVSRRAKLRAPESSSDGPIALSGPAPLN